jgi:hypothetical protein
MARSQIREEQVLDVEFVSPEEHEGLHDRDLYVEYSRTGRKVSSIDVWSDETKSLQN